MPKEKPPVSLLWEKYAYNPLTEEIVLFSAEKSIQTPFTMRLKHSGGKG
jgi:hypothetical protein